MAKQTINGPRVNAPFNTGDGGESGDQPATIASKLNAMLTEIYLAVAATTVAAAKFTQNVTAGVQTAAAGDLTGALSVICNYTLVGTAALTLRTAAQMFADAGAVVGQTYEFAIMNTNAGTITLTVPDANTTLTGTATIAQNIVRWYEVKFTSATTMTIQNIGAGAV